MSFFEIAAAVGTLGSFLLAIFVYLIRISSTLGIIIDKVEHCESRLDRLEETFGKAQLNLAQRVAWAEAKLQKKE